MICRSMAAMALPLLLTPLMSAQKALLAVEPAQFPPVVKIVFAEGVPYDKVWIGYGMFGPSGGHRYFNVPRPTGDPSYEIQAAVDGIAVNRFKALVWAPGCKMKEFDVSLGASNVELAFACETLKSVTLAGRVQQVDLGGKPGIISVGYDTVGPCLFLDTCTDACFIDCMGPTMPKIATAELKTDGTFRIELPDFSADPIASGFGDAGFSVSVHGTQWVHLEPESKDFQSRLFSLRIASSYPNNLIFIPHR